MLTISSHSQLQDYRYIPKYWIRSVYDPCTDIHIRKKNIAARIFEMVKVFGTTSQAAKGPGRQTQWRLQPSSSGVNRDGAKPYGSTNGNRDEGNGRGTGPLAELESEGQNIGWVLTCSMPLSMILTTG